MFVARILDFWHRFPFSSNVRIPLKSSAPNWDDSTRYFELDLKKEVLRERISRKKHVGLRIVNQNICSFFRRSLRPPCHCLTKLWFIHTVHSISFLSYIENYISLRWIRCLRMKIYGMCEVYIIHRLIYNIHQIYGIHVSQFGQEPRTNRIRWMMITMATFYRHFKIPRSTKVLVLF